MKKKIRIGKNIKARLIISALFPILSLFCISAPKGFFMNYALIGASGRFLSPFTFVTVNLLVCYAVGLGFFFRISGRGCGEISDVCNGRLLTLSSLFFLHVWIFLFICFLTPLASLVCILISLALGLLSVAVLTKIGR